MNKSCFFLASFWNLLGENSGFRSQLVKPEEVNHHEPPPPWFAKFPFDFEDFDLLHLGDVWLSLVDHAMGNLEANIFHEMEILEPKPTATSHLREKKCGLNCIPKKCYTWNKACKLDHSGDCHHSLPLSSWHHQQLTYLHGHLPCHSLTLSWDPWPLYRQITVNPRTQKKISNAVPLHQKNPILRCSPQEIRQIHLGLVHLWSLEAQPSSISPRSRDCCSQRHIDPIDFSTIGEVSGHHAIQNISLPGL